MDEILEIELATFPSPWSESNLQKELYTSFSRFLVAEHRGAVVGYMIAWDVSGDIQINHIAVKEELRRKGIGRSLYNELVERMQRQGALKALLEVRSKNVDARLFYHKLGFIENGVRRNYYHDDHAILMEKSL